MLIGRRLILTAMLIGSWSWAWGAEICKYTDEEGRTIYSTVPLKNGKKIACFKTAAPPPEPAPQVSKERAIESTPKPKVDNPTQARRDSDRRRILEDELANEQRLLDEAKQKLAEEEAVRYGDERNYERVLERLRPHQEAVELHQRNVESLKKEMANLR